MTSATEFSQCRRLSGQIALVLAAILLTIVLSLGIAALLFSYQIVWWRFGVGFAVSIASVFIAARICLAKSVYWQIPLQAIAYAFLIVGIPILVDTLFSNWRALLGSTGLLAASCTVLGFVAAWVLRRLQARMPDDIEA
jgi:hypothetical protein